MINLSKYLLTLTFGVAVFGAVACSNSSDSLVSSNESDGLASLDDGKKDFFTWDDVQVFDAKADLPSCDKFEGVAAQVFDEKGFFVCSNNEWEQIGVSVPAYEKLPKCEAAMNDFCVYIEENEKIEASYICDEGEWVKGIQMDGVSLCLKGGENSYEIESLMNLLNSMNVLHRHAISVEDALKSVEDALKKNVNYYRPENPIMVEKMKNKYSEMINSHDDFYTKMKVADMDRVILEEYYILEGSMEGLEVYLKIQETALEKIEQEIVNNELDSVSKEKLEAEVKELESEYESAKEKLKKEMDKFVSIKLTLENKVQKMANEELDGEAKEKLEAEVKELEREIDSVKEGIRRELRYFDDKTIVIANHIVHGWETISYSSEDLEAAPSIPSDADMAEEMVEYTKNGILQQAAQAMIAQANQSAQNVLSLLQ